MRRLLPGRQGVAERGDFELWLTKDKAGVTIALCLAACAVFGFDFASLALLFGRTIGRGAGGSLFC